MSTSAWRPGWAGKVYVFSDSTLLPGIMARRRSPRTLLALGSVWLDMARSGGGVVDAGSIADSSRDVRGDAEGKPCRWIAGSLQRRIPASFAFPSDEVSLSLTYWPDIQRSGESYSGLGVRSSSGCRYTSPDSTASAASRSFLTLATAACAAFPVNRVMRPAFRMARSQSLRSAVNETSIAMYLASVPSVARVTRSAFLKLRPMSLGRVSPAISLRSLALRVRTNSRPMSEAMPGASWTVLVLAKSPLRAPMSFSARPVRSRRFAVWALCSRANASNLTRELEKLVPQDLGAHGLPLRWVGVKALWEVVQQIGGRHAGDKGLYFLRCRLVAYIVLGGSPIFAVQ